jgi:pyruvate,water dikinase
MTEMAELARPSDSLVQALVAGNAGDIEAQLALSPQFRRHCDDYIEHFGDRCLDELKLESQTLKDDPMPLYRAVGHLAAHPPRPAQGNGLRAAAERKLDAALGRNPFRRRVFNFILRRARGRIRDRENLRFERTRVYGRVRSVFIEIGRRLSDLGSLRKPDDIFYLEAGEIAAFIRGTGTGGDLSGLVATRRREFDRFASSEDPPRRFVTCGPPQLESSIRTLPSSADTGGKLRTGQACSQGVVRGPVRIVRDPRDTPFTKGEILVAERTDPGWVTIFPLVTAMIMERGSLLSHSAIVARELNIPAVVGVDDACQWLSDGDWVELDGATGVVRKLDRADLAA